MDFEQTVKAFPALAAVKYKSRKKFPYFTDNLDLLVEAMNNGEAVAVEGGPCLFGAYEVSVFVHTDDGEVHEFDYANGKIYLSDASFSDEDTLAQFVLRNGAHVVRIDFKQYKEQLTSQEYLQLRYPFEIASALGGALVIPLPDMSYRKYLVASLETVSEEIRQKALADFDEILNFGRTLMLWLAWFGIVYSYYGIFMWLPSIVFAQGFEVVKTFEYVLIMTLAQLPGYFAAAWLVDVIGRRYTLSSFLLMSGVCAYFFGNAATPTELLMWGAAMSFFNLGAWGVIYTYTPELYPTSIRALGSGCAAGFGRIGGMLAPMFVGILLANGVQMNLIFAMFASVFILISLVVIGLGIESKQKSLEEIEKFAKEFSVRDIDEYVSSKRPQKLDFVIALAVLVIFYFCWEFYIPLSETGKYTKDIELGYNAKQDERGFYYVVDSGHSRLICFDEDSNIKYSLNDVSDGESNGLYIDDFAVDDKGLVYISASEWNGMLLSKEFIMVFDKGKYVRTITARDYSNDMINKHRFYGITVSDNVLRYVEVDKAVIFVHSVNLEADEDKVKRVEYNNAFNSIGDCAFHGDKLYVLNKSGIINSISNGKFEQVYSTKWQNEAERIPFTIAVSKDEELYFTDIRGRAIVKADVATKSTRNLFEQIDSLTINLPKEGNGFFTCRFGRR